MRQNNNPITAIEYNSGKCEILYTHLTDDVIETLTCVKNIVRTEIDDTSKRNIELMDVHWINATVREIIEQNIN